MQNTIERPMIAGASEMVDLEIRTELGSVIAKLAIPEKMSSTPAMLFNFQGAQDVTWTDENYNVAARKYLERGLPVLAFDLPCHGSLLETGDQCDGIAGFCERLQKGRDPFREFVSLCRGAIDACQQIEVTKGRKVQVFGTSRGGYCALRAMADDDRINAVTAIAPVTDWRYLREFSAIKDQAWMEELVLDRWIHRYAGKPIFLTIGSCDTRVSTASCAKFVHRVMELEQQMGLQNSRLSFRMDHASPGHSCNLDCREQGADYLLEYCEA